MESEPFFEKVSGFQMDSNNQKFSAKLIDFTLIVDGTNQQKLSFDMTSEFGYANAPIVQVFDKWGVKLTM